MDIQFAKYKELIEQQLEELTAEDVLGQSAQKTVELDQQNLSYHIEYDSFDRRQVKRVVLPKRLSSVLDCTYAKPNHTNLPNHYSRCTVG